jgi:carboxyl-terminal processing protease
VNPRAAFRSLLPLLALLLVPLAPLSSAAPREFRVTPTMADETRLLVQLLENVHFRGKELGSDEFKELIPQFMRELDFNRLFFLESDRVELTSRYDPVRLSKDLHYRGNLDAAFDTFRIYRERVAARVTWIQQALEGDFDFTTDATYRFERSKEPFPADQEEADRLWRQRLKYELLQDLLNDKSFEEARETVQRRYARLLKNLEDIDAEEVQEIYLTSLTRMYDPHTSYMSPSSLEDFGMQMRLSLVGIGAQLIEEDGVCVIRELIPGGPADLSKQLAPNDRIIAVAQGESGEPVDVLGMKLRRVVDLIRGEKGTTVRLTVIPGDAAESSVRREVVIVRDVVKLNASRAVASVHELPAEHGGTVRVGVIALPSFYGLEDSNGGGRTSATQDVLELIGKLEAEGIEGLVLDLRRNGGGLLSEAVELTGLFIPRGPVVQVKSSNGRIEVRSDEDKRVAYAGPLVVLTSRYSASASEIVAGALQNHGRAIVVGDNSTHGKGTVQAVLEMSGFLPRRLALANPRTGAARMTVQKFYLPNGASTQNRGVVSDVVLPTVESLLPIGEGDLPNALAWDRVPPAAFAGTPLDGRFTDLLRERSQSRQALSEEFAHLRRHIDWFRDRQERKTVSLNLEERRRQKERDDLYREEMKAERARLAAANYPMREVMLDGVVRHAPAEAEAELDAEEAISSDADELRLDIHLRESMRILADAINLWQNPQLWTAESRAFTAATPAKVEPTP